jgi:hypothetical protein
MRVVELHHPPCHALGGSHVVGTELVTRGKKCGQRLAFGQRIVVQRAEPGAKTSSRGSGGGAVAFDVEMQAGEHRVLEVTRAFAEQPLARLRLREHALEVGFAEEGQRQL